MFPTRPAGVDKKAALLAQARADREARSGQKKVEQQNARQDSAARRIQQFWVRQHAKRVVKDKQRADWDALTTQLPATPALGLVRNLKLVFLLLRFYDRTECPMDSRRLSSLCKLLLSKTTIVMDEGAFTTATTTTTEGVSTSPASSPHVLSPNPDTGSTASSEQQRKAMMQVPFQMILLHSRYADLASAILLRLLRLCVTTITGNQVDPNASTQRPTPLKTYSRSQVSSPTSASSKSLAQELYLSGAELRFLMAFVDVNTYRLPETVAAAIRTQMQDRGAALIIKVLDSGRFYKDVRAGLQLRSEALLQLQDRAKKTSVTPAEASTQKALSLWITAIWRCCFLLQSVDKEATEKSTGKTPSRHQRDDLINMHSDESTVVGITCRILTIALFVECLDDLCLQLAMQSQLLSESLDAILDLRHRQYILSSMSLNETLYLLANLTQLYRIQLSKNTASINATLKNRLVEVIVVLLTHCQKYVSGIQTTEFRQYHPIFSWTNLSQKDHQLSATQVTRLFSQLDYIWSRDFALEAFRGLLNLAIPPVSSSADIATNGSNTGGSEQQPSVAPTSHHNRMSSQSDLKSGNHAQSITSDPQGALLAIEVQQACQLYMTLMRSLESQRTKILVTLMYLPSFLTRLWRFMNTLGPKGEMHIYLEAASGFSRHGLDQEPLISILQVFCECSARFLITLDDDDMYDQQKYWTLSELVFMSGFLNQFCFAVLSQQEDTKAETDPKDLSGTTSPMTVSTPLPPIFYHARQVLMQLYERDCRRAFCPPNHWLLMHPTKSVFQSPLQLLASLTLSSSSRSKGNGTANNGAKKGGGFSLFSSSKAPPQYATPKEFIAKVCQKDRTALQILETMPHVIPFSARLEIFREFIKEERAQRMQSLALVRPDLHQSVMVRVRRGYILEDGYQSLGQLSANGWKNTIRVKFTNEVGAAEAGIDQGGPFKEFMESFLEAGFSPNLNLFTTTTASMNMMYPSPTSMYTHPHNGLELFRLFGKMLGKAMYEGLLIEVKFANFFLSKILGRTVFLDEMRSFDEQVFRNLMFLKKYEGDVEDLGLTFSLDEDIFGTHRTVELMRGGRDIEVTKENRINYIFQVSDYRLNKQIQDQSRAFIDGFRSIIPLPWISIFSPQELHRVMAGDDVDFDVQDLRSYTEYQNGYFDQHPVIRNLWAVLNEFSSEEKRAFLKFVTSCSKPPLGGFKYLHPPFSIRLVVSPTTSDLNYDSTPAPAPRQFGSGASAPPAPISDSSNTNNRHQRSTTTPTSSSTSSSGFGSRLRSAFGGGGNSSNQNNSNRSSTMSTSSSTSSLSSASSPSPRSTPQMSRPMQLPSDETPAALGVVKSFFGGVLGGAGSSSESGKKARLPTSSTCFNLLKLPPFSSKSVLKEKLRYAITSNTGFELS
ncbi:Ubiquitin-protein ligase E3B [Mortierella sp. GBA35]|nr:Ubiquitin-protein ligase E3B [Mortierella sp. GBA35]